MVNRPFYIFDLPSLNEQRTSAHDLVPGNQSETFCYLFVHIKRLKISTFTTITDRNNLMAFCSYHSWKTVFDYWHCLGNYIWNSWFFNIQRKLPNSILPWGPGSTFFHCKDEKLFSQFNQTTCTYKSVYKRDVKGSDSTLNYFSKPIIFEPF